jgi:hypothetical protein
MESLTALNLECLREAQAIFRGDRPSRVGFAGSLAETGEEYIVIASGGIKEQGKCFPALCNTVEGAVRLWLSTALEYAKGKEGTIYWRHLPMVDAIEHNGDIWFAVYSRLLISDKPITHRVAEDGRLEKIAS